MISVEKYFLNAKDAESELVDTGVTIGHVAQSLATGLNNAAFRKRLSKGRISHVEVRDIAEVRGVLSI